MRYFNGFLLLLLVVPLSAQIPPQPVVSPEVHSDNRVTFRFRDPNAKEVALELEGTKRTAMLRDDRGIWSVTTAPLEPDLYGYSFVADGVNLLDPSNPLMKPNILNTQSLLHVPGAPSLPWEVNEVPHGVIHRHFYKSRVVGDQRDFYVYTPPGYDPRGRTAYPVLYLLHGFSDDATAWIAVGRANVILDNLVARGKARPMVIVMPLGYGAPEFLKRTGPRDASLWRANVERFKEATLQEVLPQVEQAYRVSRDRNRRAIAGLSMGGAEALITGLNSLDRFAWVGAFSSGGLGDDYGVSFPGLDAKSATNLRLLWIACGKEDRLFDGNVKFIEWLKSKGIRATGVETPGAHTWTLWRRYLSDFAPLLFQ